MGVLYAEGRGVAINCASAVHSLKSVAERGQPVASTVSAALSLYKSGDHAGARLLYAFVAEAGLEVV
jgi:TPR repeat protein